MPLAATILDRKLVSVLALSLGLFIVIVFLVTIAKLSNGNSIEGFDHTLRPSLLKE